MYVTIFFRSFVHNNLGMVNIGIAPYIIGFWGPTGYSLTSMNRILDDQGSGSGDQIRTGDLKGYEPCGDVLSPTPQLIC